MADQEERKVEALELKVIEICHRSFTDFLIADKDTSAGGAMSGTEPVYCQVKDRLTADIFVKSVNMFPELLEALILLEREMVLSGNAESVDYGWKPAILKTRAAISKATNNGETP
jgi:hypothetical protein